MQTTCWPFSIIVVFALGVVACSDGEDRDRKDLRDESPEQTGKACMVATDCYPGVDQAELSGAAQCLDRVRDGYCTHLCETDADCCAAEGECDTELKQVCAPFESTGLRMCFLSCEGTDLRAADGGGAVDDQEYCQREASADFICRSSGGGSANRKVCVPGDCGVGADCSADEDCDTDLECVDELKGGYCGRRDCEADANCPGDSVCVEDEGNTYCLRTCEGETDCSFCRHPDDVATCTDQVTFVEATGVRVCRP
jgi:hypothetical protein